MAITCGYRLGYEGIKVVMSLTASEQYPTSGWTAISVGSAIPRACGTCLFYNEANGRLRCEPSDDVDVEELDQSSPQRPETDHGVPRDVMLVVLRQLSHRPLLQAGVQRSIARTRCRRLIGVQTGRDNRHGKLGRKRERVTHGQG
jgi:hypothetical protein